MKIILVAINAKYIHSNLAVYSLRAYAKQHLGVEYNDQIEIAEYTINQYADDIIQDIYKQKPDVLAFSCYIWNIEMVREITSELKKVLPRVPIWLGGPEVSYDAKTCLTHWKHITGIMIGEGETTFLELSRHYLDSESKTDESSNSSLRIESIDGLAIRNGDEIVVTPNRELLSMDELPFVYDDLSKFENKIVYYETSRGCPYSCSYCLSSIDKRVRLRSFSLVEKELQFFLDSKVPQVKFIDRTFNCNRKHAMAIWSYLNEHDNGVTNFHFEISADLLREEELNLLSTLRKGLIQLEIGVQSTNPKTIEAIHRKMDLKNLSYAVNKINQGLNIHQHLDLIAGLPYEDLESFKQSFQDVYEMEPNQLQLGFLKVLKGSYMHEVSKEHGIIYKSTAPYEVLCTNWLSYDEILILKSVEEMVEIYYNSGQFTYTIRYLAHFYANPFELYRSLAKVYESSGNRGRSHSRMDRYEFLLEYNKQVLHQDEEVLKQLLVFDLYLRENLKSRPSFAMETGEWKELYHGFYWDDAKLQKYLPAYEGYQKKQVSRMTHIEYFTIDVIETSKTGVTIPNKMHVLFDYQERNPLNYEARTVVLDI